MNVVTLTKLKSVCVQCKNNPILLDGRNCLSFRQPLKVNVISISNRVKELNGELKLLYNYN